MNGTDDNESATEDAYSFDVGMIKQNGYVSDLNSYWFTSIHMRWNSNHFGHTYLIGSFADHSG